MSYKTIIITLVAFAWTSRSGAQFDHLLHKTHGQRYMDIGKIVDRCVADLRRDSADALKETHALAGFALDNHDDDLLQETKLIVAIYYHYQSSKMFSHQEVLDHLTRQLEEARKNNITWLQGKLELMLAMEHRNYKEYESAFEHVSRAYDLVKGMSDAEFPDKTNNLCEFANLLYAFRDYRTAIFYLREALKDSVHDPWDGLYIQRSNTMGLCYRNLNMLDSSNYYFQQTYKIAQSEHNIQWEGISCGNLGENLFLEKEYEKARPLIQKDADIAISYDPGLASNAFMLLGEISMAQKDLDGAEKNLGLARSCAYKSGQYSRLGKLYPVLLKFNLLKGRTGLAAMFADSSFIVRDSLDRQFNALIVTRGQQKVELEKHRLAMEESNNEREMKTLQRNALVVIILLTLILAFFIYDRLRRKYREKQLQLERTEAELASATRELNTFTRNISEKNKLIEDLQVQIGTPDSEAIRQLQQSTILTDEQWIEFKNLFDRVHSGYLQRLREKLSGLTPAETRFVVLNKLKLTGKEMASMLGVGSDAIRQYRSRLRKKLNLSEEDNLEALIDKI